MKTKRILSMLLAFCIYLPEFTLGVSATPDYTCTFHANNGTDETDIESVAQGTKISVEDDTFTYGKCEIENWNTEPDGSGMVYYIDDEITISEDIDLYAQWVLPLNKLESFTSDDYEWSGNDSSPYSFTIKNDAVLYAGVTFPSQSSEDTVTVTVDGDCDIKVT